MIKAWVRPDEQSLSFPQVGVVTPRFSEKSKIFVHRLPTSVLLIDYIRQPGHSWKLRLNVLMAKTSVKV